MKPSSTLAAWLVVLPLAACSSSEPGKPQTEPSGGSSSAGHSGKGGGAVAGQATGGGSEGGSAGVATAGEAGAPGGTGGMAGEAPTDIDLGPNVLVFDPATPMADSQAKIDAVYTEQYTSQFGDKRYALLFKPGSYQLDVKIAYYTQALGLGQKPTDVQIAGSVRSTGTNNGGNATLSFWRGAENLTVTPAMGTSNMWAVSQGASLRRIHVVGSLLLADAGNSSGGFIADSRVESTITSASQQQYFLRTSEWQSWVGGVWNMVFCGDPQAPTDTWPTKPYTVVPEVPAIREKPFLVVDQNGDYAVQVPALRKATAGASWTTNQAPGKAATLSQFYVAHEGDTAASINAALAQGKHLLLTPAIYHLDAPLDVTQPGTIVLGLGQPTLIAEAGTPALRVADVSGVTVAGVLVQAGAMYSPTLSEVGPDGSKATHADDPTLLHDVYCRVGGAAPGMAASCMTINSHDVIGDNLWLWRADHGMGVGWTSNRSKNGLIVNGDDVTIHGLFVEHFQEYQTLWNGNGGHVFFYQSEMPYDPPTQPEWQHGVVNGYAAYKVADSVTTHEAWGVGIYSAFKQPVVADNAIETPSLAGVALHHLVTVWLNGSPTSAINHIINGTGAAATQANRKSTAD